MKEYKRIVGRIAKNYSVDVDELLIRLWDHETKFAYIKKVTDVIRSKDLGLVKRIIEKIQKNESAHKPLVPKKTKPRSYDFASMGKIIDQMHYLTPQEIVNIHYELVDDASRSTDPISPAGVRDLGLLESATFHSKTSYGYQKKYPTVETAGAALMYAISNNHPFYNGNKRSALVALLSFLDKHKMTLKCNDDELFKTSLLVAKSQMSGINPANQDDEIFALADWIKRNSIFVQRRGERPISRRRLEQILKNFDCHYDNQQQAFIRKIERRYLASDKIIRFKISLTPISMGNEIDKGLLKDLRRALKLTNDDGITDEMFYNDIETETGEFIERYSKVLKHLGRV